MRNLIILNFFCAMIGSELFATFPMVSAGIHDIGGDNNGYVQRFDPFSKEIKGFIIDNATSFGASACFVDPTNETYKIICVGQDHFFVATLANEGLTDSMNARHVVRPVQYQDFPSLGSYVWSFISSNNSEVSARISTLALVNNENMTVLVGDTSGFTTEYDLLGNKIRTFEKTQRNDRGGVNTFMMYEHEGKAYLASGGNNGQIYIRDFASGNVVKEYMAPKCISSIVIYKKDDGIYLIAGMTGYTMQDNPIGGIICWNIRTGEQLYKIDYDSTDDYKITPVQWGFVAGLALIDGQILVIATDGNVKVFDAITGTYIKSFGYLEDPKRVWVTNVVPFKNEGKTYVVIGDNSGVINVWDFDETIIVATLQMPVDDPKKEPNACRNIALFSVPDNGLFVSAVGDSGVVVTWSLDSFKKISEIAPNDPTVALMSVATLPNLNIQDGIVSNSSEYNLGYDIPLFSIDENLSL